MASDKRHLQAGVPPDYHLHYHPQRTKILCSCICKWTGCPPDIPQAASLGDWQAIVINECKYHYHCSLIWETIWIFIALVGSKNYSCRLILFPGFGSFPGVVLRSTKWGDCWPRIRELSRAKMDSKHSSWRIARCLRTLPASDRWRINKLVSSM
jgi:hypothetical protein